MEVLCDVMCNIERRKRCLTTRNDARRCYRRYKPYALKSLLTQNHMCELFLQTTTDHEGTGTGVSACDCDSRLRPLKAMASLISAFDVDGRTRPSALLKMNDKQAN